MNMYYVENCIVFSLLRLFKERFCKIISERYLFINITVAMHSFASCVNKCLYFEILMHFLEII